LAKNKNGIAKGPKKKPIIAQNDLFEPLLDAMKYNKPAKQIDITNRTKYPILNPSISCILDILGTLMLNVPYPPHISI
jgi:hypothetical protein